MNIDTIITGDNAEVLKTFPPDCIDLTVTSPPYDNLRTYDGHAEFDFETVARELYRVTKPGGVVVWVVGDATINGSETGTSFRQALYFMECGFNLHDTMIYHTTRQPLNHNRYEQAFEYMFVFSKNSPRVFNPIKVQKLWKDHRQTKIMGRHTDGSYKIGRASETQEKITVNIWRYNTGGGHTTNDNVQHSAIFPEALAADHILSWSNPGDLVLDPFAGSGTTLKKAKELGRFYIGIEKNPDYVKIIVKRLLATGVPLFA